MKTAKTLFAVGFAALSFTASSHADVTINITGSTAFRAAVHNTIRAMMPDERWACNTSDLTTADRAIFIGTVSGISGQTTIRTSWSGSAAGIANVAGAVSTAGFYNYAAANVAATTGGVLSYGGATESAVPRFAFSDVAQTSTSTKSPVLQSVGVGVVPFVWVTNETGASKAGFDNITPQQIDAVLSTGYVPLSMFTGSVSDAGDIVIATGRTNTSGTRITALAESGYGINRNVNQFYGETYSGDGLALTALSTQGNGGLGSGGALAILMGKTSAAVSLEGGDPIPLVLISYLGESDANNAVTAGAKKLKYNGVEFTNANVRNGSYTFWGYQNLLNPSGLAADETTFRNSLIAAIPANVGSAGIATNTMNVTRAGSDGGIVLPNN